MWLGEVCTDDADANDDDDAQSKIVYGSLVNQMSQKVLQVKSPRWDIQPCRNHTLFQLENLLAAHI